MNLKIDWTPGELAHPRKRIADLQSELELWQNNAANWKLENDELEAKHQAAQRSIELLQGFILSSTGREKLRQEYDDRERVARHDRMESERRRTRQALDDLHRAKLKLAEMRALCIALAIACAILALGHLAF